MYILPQNLAQTENGDPETAMALYFSYQQIKDGGVRHFEFPQNAITQSPVELQLQILERIYLAVIGGSRCDQDRHRK